MKNKKVYIIYKYDSFKNDLEYIKEYYNAEEIKKDYKLENKKSVYNYTIDNADNITADNIGELLKNKYKIIIDRI